MPYIIHYAPRTKLEQAINLALRRWQGPIDKAQAISLCERAEKIALKGKQKPQVIEYPGHANRKLLVIELRNRPFITITSHHGNDTSAESVA